MSVNLMTYISIGFFAILVILVGFTVALATIRITVAEKINSFDNQTEANNQKMIPYKDLELSVSKSNTGLRRLKQFWINSLAKHYFRSNSGVIGTDVCLNQLQSTQHHYDR